MSSPQIVIDLNRRHFTRTRGPLSIVGTWVRIERDWQGCLAIFRTNDERLGEVHPCIVTQAKSWIWSEDIGDPRQSIHIARSWLGPLRLPDDAKSIFLLHSIVHDHLGDLLTIPVHPIGAPGALLGELTVTHRPTGKTREVELRDV